MTGTRPESHRTASGRVYVALGDMQLPLVWPLVEQFDPWLLIPPWPRAR